jgi:hypothetical protein
VRAYQVYQDSKLAIDHEHRDVMGEEEVEELLNLYASRDRQGRSRFFTSPGRVES